MFQNYAIVAIKQFMHLTSMQLIDVTSIQQLAAEFNQTHFYTYNKMGDNVHCVLLKHFLLSKLVSSSFL